MVKNRIYNYITFELFKTFALVLFSLSLIAWTVRAVNFLETQNISCELIDLRSIKPMDWELIFSSVKKTKRLLVLDTSSITGSISGEIVAKTTTELFSEMISPPSRIGMPDVPVPTSFALTKDFYPSSTDIIDSVAKTLGIKVNTEEFDLNTPHDVPGEWFKGPF